jgi:hypothetical protein
MDYDAKCSTRLRHDPAFPLVEYLHGVDDGPVRERKINAGSPELGEQHTEIEFLDVESAQVTTIEEGGQAGGDPGEARFRRHILVTDTVDRRGLLGDRDPGVDASSPVVVPTVREELENADLDDSVGLRVSPRGLEVDDRQGAGQL